jgi:hypothetical protein
LPSVTLGKAFAECFPTFTECFRHSAKRPILVVIFGVHLETEGAGRVIGRRQWDLKRRAVIKISRIPSSIEILAIDLGSYGHQCITSPAIGDQSGPRVSGPMARIRAYPLAVRNLLKSPWIFMESTRRPPYSKNIATRS